ncbi:MAG: tetratricopeptide repeat protein [Chloroflexi bacterium]|nr:tetratricopeptide repeat protein [Chloroflexota bacterium]
MTRFSLRNWPSWATTRNLTRAIWITGGLLVVVSLAFAAYYYRDRFYAQAPLSPAERALREAEQAVRENPSDPDLRVHLAALYYENHLYDRAFEAASQVLKAYPNHEAALLLAGMAAVQQHRLEEAIPLLERFIALRKDRPGANADLQLEMAYYFVGLGYVTLGQSDKAIEALQAALRISPTDADALYQLGVAYQSQGQCEKALAAFEQAVRLVPDFVDAYQGLAQCYGALGQEDRRLYAEGMVAFGEKRYRTARAKLEQAVERLPDYAPAWLGLGLVYEKLGDLEAAQQALARALELAPHDLAIEHAYGRVQAARQATPVQEAQP